MTHYPVVWSFETKHYRVTFAAEPESLDPAESFERQDDIAMVRRGDVEWFRAAVRVYYRARKSYAWQEIAADYLGGCAYKSAMEFCTSHRDADPLNRNSSIMRAARGGNVAICHYFPSMVSEAIAAARKAMEEMRKSA